MIASQPAVPRPGAPHDTERDDPRNTVLDLVEAAIRSAVDLGLEAPLRSRMARLLPVPVAAPSDSRSASRPEGAWLDFTPDDELKLQILVGDLKRIAKLKMTEHAHDAAKRVRAWVEQQLEAAKKGRPKA
jgi:hypothetical protein